MLERDWVMRVVQQLAQFLARALGLAKQGQVVEAQALLEAACLETLGIEYQALSFVDSRSAAEMLGNVDRIVAFARLLGGMAEVAQASGDEAKLRARRRHAYEMWCEAARRRPNDGALERERQQAAALLDAWGGAGTS